MSSNADLHGFQMVPTSEVKIYITAMHQFDLSVLLHTTCFCLFLIIHSFHSFIFDLLGATFYSYPAS